MYRVRNGKLLGVCGGVAEYLSIDPTVIRLIWLIAALCGGFGFFAYIIAAIVMPYESEM
jgi:phage shock protein PspC (stress-responsive transcriptional regulator)